MSGRVGRQEGKRVGRNGSSCAGFWAGVDLGDEEVAAGWRILGLALCSKTQTVARRTDDTDSRIQKWRPSRAQ